jgi:glyoxylase-like metal-dependent hydrolase (beta-lactamase superfamily II)
MMAEITRYQVGAVTITPLNSGLLVYEMADGMALPERDWPPVYAADLAQPLHVPMLAVLVQTPQTTLLVDAGSYDLEPDSPMRVPGYTPPPSIPDQLRDLGVDPARVEYLVITHLHLDHYNGLTEEVNGARRLCFPNATVYVGAADWANTARQVAIHTPGSPEAVTLGEVARQGRLTAVDGVTQLAPGVEIVPMPGETPGHLGLCVRSDGQTAYVVGDLFHHVIEVEHPAWHVTWADRASMAATRRWFFTRAAEEKPLVVASHIAGAGRLEQSGDGWRWRPE